LRGRRVNYLVARRSAAASAADTRPWHRRPATTEHPPEQDQDQGVPGAFAGLSRHNSQPDGPDDSTADAECRICREQQFNVACLPLVHPVSPRPAAPINAASQRLQRSVLGIVPSALGPVSSPFHGDPGRDVGLYLLLGVPRSRELGSALI